MRKKIKKTGFIIFLLLFIIANIVYLGNLSIQRLSYYERITLQDEDTDIGTIIFRVNQIRNAFDIGQTGLLGVGLGNYYDYLPMSQKINKYLINWRLSWYTTSTEYVHNLVPIRFYFGV